MAERKVVTLPEVRKHVAQYDPEFAYDESNGICALVSISDMGFCKDGVTRWYHFEMDGIPCVFFKR